MKSIDKFHKISDFINKISKDKRALTFWSITLILISALLQTFILQVFMDPCNLIAGGFTGIAIMMHKVFGLFHIEYSTSAGIVLLNIPAILLCYRNISKRFTWLSCLQFGLVSLFLKVFYFTPFFDDKILNVLFGGLLWGGSISLALRAGGSSGGTDFIAQYIANKIHKGIWYYVFFFNCILLFLFGFVFGWIHAGYSIVFQFLSTKTISMFYQQYAQVTVEFTTQCPNEVISSFMETCHHGMSILQGYGGYEHKTIFLCKSVISCYEAQEVIKAVQEREPNVIINTYRTENFYGRFYRKQ